MKRILRWLVILIAVVGVAMLALSIAGYGYVVQAVLHGTADIDDYKIFSNRKVEALAPQPWALSTQYNSHVLNTNEEIYHKQLGTIALLAVKNDSILFEHYWAGYSENSMSNSFSVAKSIISLLVGIAVQDGKIKSIDDPVGNYLPGYATGEKAQITIRNLLTMSSGLNFEESYSSPFCHTTEAYYGSDLPALVNRLEVVMKPGTQFRYKSGDTQLLQQVLEKATGEKTATYLSEKLWTPLGAEHEALWSLDHHNGTEKGYCCINSNVRDFARIGELVLNNGNWHGKQLIPESYLNEAFTPCMIKDIQGLPCDYYGLQWWLSNYNGHKVRYARGILGQYIIVVPEEKLVIVRLGTERGKKIGNHFEETFRMIDLFSK